MALIARRYITSDRYNPSKKQSSKQKAHLISLNSKMHTEKENNPNFSNTTPRPVTRTQNELAVQQEKAITYERRYQSEHKQATRKDCAAASLVVKRHSPAYLRLMLLRAAISNGICFLRMSGKKVEVLMDAVGRYIQGEMHPKHNTQHSMEQPDGSNNAQGMPGCEDEYDDE
ncbi:hypothetical protein EDB19DRAFT_1824053 [Suillus lakei]|nr:hypothetical protein EDB19DRAFT_1824053 [Suillus lakei]